MEERIKTARTLWNQCFHDPQMYEDFYFQQVCLQNKIYLDGERGMLHLNPYVCHVGKHLERLHYIVGVATHAAYRRQGIMRKLLRQALTDMWNNKEPFTYLMPADTAYYQPFGFVSVQEECCRQYGQQTDRDETEGVKFLSYELFNHIFDEEQRKQIFNILDGALAKRYCVTAMRNEEYIRLLYREKACQNGDVVFVFDANGNVLGYFAYAVDNNLFCVEQSVGVNGKLSETFIQKYWNGKVKQWFSYPYMLRVVNVTSFLRLFSPECKTILENQSGFFVMDDFLKQNEGYYCPETDWILRKNPLLNQEYKMISVTELLEQVLGANNSFDNRVWFSEIV